MTSFFLTLAAVSTLLTAFAHSYFGEKRLIGPLVAAGNGVMRSRLAQQVIRLAWHLTSLLWIAQALVLFRAAENIKYFDPTLVAGLGVLYVAIGLVDALVTRGRHLGWPLLLAIGAFALLSLP
jgi:hypothetical protein